jgi:hypothetical protein
MRRLVACLLTLAPALALADNWRDSLIDAAEEMDDALGAARRGGAQCRNGMKLLIDQAIDEVDAISDRGGRRISDAQNRVNSLIASAQRSNCPERVARKLTRAAESLEDARNDRRRGRDRDDRDDDRRYNNNAPPGVAQRVSTPVELAQLQLVPNVIHDTENKVQVNVPEVRFHDSRGLKFRLGARVRAQNGQFGEWQVDNFYQVPQDEYAWPNATTFYIRHSTLRGIDSANGQFVVRVSVLNENNEELGGVDQPLNVNFRGPMVAAPASPATPPPGQGQPGSAAHVRPIPTLVQRDCGTGQDPGCGVNRNGVLAMDKAGFDGLIRSLQSNPSDLGREQIVYSVLVNNGLTAAQFGIVLDQLRSEISKLNVTRKAAPRLTNPQAALGHSAKFRSSLNQQEYVRIIAAEK